MALIPEGMGVSDAARAYSAIEASITVAMWAAAGRATDPNSFPILPPTRDLAAAMTRKALADLLELGFAPDGWETAYFDMNLGGVS